MPLKLFKIYKGRILERKPSRLLVFHQLIYIDFSKRSAIKMDDLPNFRHEVFTKDISVSRKVYRGCRAATGAPLRGRRADK